MAKELVVYNPEDFWAFYQTGGTYESIYIQLSRQGLLRGEGRGKQSGIGIGQGWPERSFGLRRRFHKEERRL